MTQLFTFWLRARGDRHQTSPNAGMTLLEVLAVVIIIGILAALIAPGWVSFVNRQRAIRARDHILQELRDTQANARRTRQDRTLGLIANPGGIPQLDPDDRDDAVNLGEGDIEDGMLSLEVLQSDGTSILDGNGEFTITFSPNGGLDVENQALDLPITITVASGPNFEIERCLIVETLLGATRNGIDEECAP